jgi:hypothetical protein
MYSIYGLFDMYDLKTHCLLTKYEQISVADILYVLINSFCLEVNITNWNKL